MFIPSFVGGPKTELRRSPRLKSRAQRAKGRVLGAVPHAELRLLRGRGHLPWLGAISVVDPVLQTLPISSTFRTLWTYLVDTVISKPSKLLRHGASRCAA